MDTQALLFVKLADRRTPPSGQDAEDHFYNTVCEVPWPIRITWVILRAVVVSVCGIFARCRHAFKRPAKRKAMPG